MSEGTTLVTGVRGLIGGAVARRLAEAGRCVVASDVGVSASAEAPYPVLEHDLPSPHRWHDIIARHDITRVVHAGGISGPMVLGDQPARICDINVDGLAGLLEAARIRGIGRIVWFSSIVAYGDRTDLTPVDEDTPLRPATVYAATKAAGEALLAGFQAEHGIDGVALRVASCYGPGRTTSCLVRTLIEDGLADRPTAVRTRPHQTRQHVFVEDVVDAVVAALDAPTLGRRVYNIGPGRTQTLDEIVEGVRQVVPGARAEVGDDGLGWNTFGIGPMAIDAARRDLGFEPRTDFAAGAALTRDWVLSRPRAV